MKIVRWRMSMGLVGCSREGEFEVADDMTDEEIENEVFSAVCEAIEWNHEIEPCSSSAAET